MNFEPKSEEIVLRSLRYVTLDDVNASVDINLSDKKIKKIISSSVVSTVEKIVPTSKSVKLELKIRADVVVEWQDGEYECISGENVATTLIVNSFIEPSTPIFVKSGVISKTCTIVGQGINVNALLKLSGWIVAEDKQTCIVDAGVENQKQISATFTDIVASNSQEFSLEFELEQPQGVKKVLSYESEVTLISVEAGDDMVTLNGKIATNLVYLSDDENPKLKNQYFLQNFSHELLCSNLHAEDKVWANLELNQTKLELQGELNSAKGTILLSISQKANIFVQKDIVKTIVVDAFCPNYNLNATSRKINNLQIPTITLLSDRIDGSVSLSEDSPRIDRILCVPSANIIVEATESGEQGIKVVGKMCCCVVFTLDDEECSIASYCATIPFETRLKCETPENVVVVGKIKDIDARNKRAKEIDIIADVDFCITLTKATNISLLTSITLGEKRNVSNCAFKIFYVENAEDLWSLSKKLGVPSSVITEQNPELEFPFLEPKQIVVYRERQLL